MLTTDMRGLFFDFEQSKKGGIVDFKFDQLCIYDNHEDTRFKNIFENQASE